MTAAIFEKTWTVRASAAKAAQRAGLAKGSYEIMEHRHDKGHFYIADLTGIDDEAAAEMEAQVLKDCGQDDGAAGLDGGFEPSGDMLAREAAERVARLEASAKNKPVKIKPAPAADPIKAITAPRPANATNLPTPPDFSKPSHAPYRKRLAAMIAMAEAGDDVGLAALTFKVERSSQKIMARYRDACLKALGR